MRIRKETNPSTATAVTQPIPRRENKLLKESFPPLASRPIPLNSLGNSKTSLLCKLLILGAVLHFVPNSKVKSNLPNCLLPRLDQEDLKCVTAVLKAAAYWLCLWQSEAGAKAHTLITHQRVATLSICNKRGCHKLQWGIKYPINREKCTKERVGHDKQQGCRGKPQQKGSSLSNKREYFAIGIAQELEKGFQKRNSKSNPKKGNPVCKRLHCKGSCYDKKPSIPLSIKAPTLDAIQHLQKGVRNLQNNSNHCQLQSSNCRCNTKNFSPKEIEHLLLRSKELTAPDVLPNNIEKYQSHVLKQELNLLSQWQTTPQPLTKRTAVLLDDPNKQQRLKNKINK